MTESAAFPVREVPGTPPVCLISVRVTPRASRNEVVGVVDGRLRIRLQAPPVEGAANKALTAFLADVLNVPSSSVSVDRGQTGREKIVRVAHATITAARCAHIFGSIPLAKTSCAP